MRKRSFIGFLVAEATVCVLFCVLQASLTAFFSAAAAFPFEQIGFCLRALSLSGVFGNIIAFVLYFAFCLLPAAMLLVLRKKRLLRAEDGLLGLLSAMLFAVIYFMINPGMITGAAGGQSVGKAVLGVMAYSVLCGYFVLRALRLFRAGGTEKLTRYMSVMLCLLNVVFVYMAFGASFGGLLSAIEALRAGNSGNEHLLGASYFFLILQFVVDALPYVLNVFIVFSALRLLGRMHEYRYSAEALEAAERLSRRCVVALSAVVISNITFNSLQLLFAKSLMVINGTVQIPVFSIAFVLAALLLTRFVEENKRLKDDNDMFI